MPKIKTQTIEMYYESYGEGEPVIFVPGFSADHTVWLDIADVFAKHYQVILVDNRGSGQSDCPDESSTVEMLADDLLALIDALNIEKAHFIGNSMGGAIIQQLAVSYPERVCSAVLSSSFTKISTIFGLTAKARLAFYQYNIPTEIMVESIVPWAFSSRFLEQPGRVDELIQLSLDNPYLVTEVGYRGQLNALLTFDSSDWISQINVPTLFISGEMDIIAFPDDIIKMANQVEGSQFYCIDKAGHLPHVENPEIFTEIVFEFLNDNSLNNARKSH